MAIFSKNIDMLNGTIWDKMVVFAIPLALTGVLQQLYNLADVAVLGHFVSNEAVAAVGTNVPIVGLIVAFCIGLSIGANVVVARYLGMRKYDDASRAVHTAFATAVIFGVLAMAIGELCIDFDEMDASASERCSPFGDLSSDVLDGHALHFHL